MRERHGDEKRKRENEQRQEDRELISREIEQDRETEREVRSKGQRETKGWLRDKRIYIYIYIYIYIVDIHESEKKKTANVKACRFLGVRWVR